MDVKYFDARITEIESRYANQRSPVMDRNDDSVFHVLQIDLIAELAYGHSKLTYEQLREMARRLGPFLPMI